MGEFPRKADGRRVFSVAFKQQIVGQILSGQKTLAEFSRELEEVLLLLSGDGSAGGDESCDEPLGAFRVRPHLVWGAPGGGGGWGHSLDLYGSSGHADSPEPWSVATHPRLQPLPLLHAHTQNRFRTSSSHRRSPCTGEQPSPRYSSIISVSGHLVRRLRSDLALLTSP